MITTAAIALVTTSVGTFAPGTPSSDPARITADAPFEATVAHASTNAGARGTLFFLGTEADGTITAPTGAAHELGRALFTSHNTAPEARSGLDLGAFGAGDTLHFAYLVTRGVSVAPTGSTFRTDTDLDPAHFTVVDTTVIDEATTVYRVGVEDIRDPARSDWDYNDVVFDVSVRLVPTPGAGTLALASLALVARRRRG